MKKLLICTTDAGGAANLAPVADYIKKNELFSLKLVVNEFTKKYFYEHNGSIINVSIQNETDASNLLNKQKPDVILCGTARSRVAPDKLLLGAGKMLNIRTVAINDEWHNYSKRFFDESDTVKYLPDKIALNDNRAKSEAIEEGIPEQICFATGSPALTNIYNKYVSYLKNDPPFPDFLSNDQLIITFLSETHSIDFGIKQGDSGPSGNYLGYTEESVLNDIIQSLKALNKKCYLVEKLHPSDNRKNKIDILNDRITHIRIKDCDLSNLLWYSHLIIGMISITLVEASFLKPPIVSYQPNLIGKNYCTAGRLGLIPQIFSSIGLKNWIMKEYRKNINKTKSLNEFDFIDQSSVNNIIELFS